MIFAKIASAVYVLWGILHVYAAWNVYLMGQNMEPGMVQGRIFQDAWNLLFFALFGIVVAIVYNWKNNKTGYWLNAIVVSMGDIGFILTILLPGYLPLIPEDDVAGYDFPVRSNPGNRLR
ncbi:MAG: hypothetical protein AAGB12_12600, partial [Pseudomonadota bacterium]